MTTKQITKKQAEDLLHSIISASHAAHQLRQIRYLSHVKEQRERNLFKKNLESLISSLLDYEKDMELLDSKESEPLEDTYNYFYEMLEVLSTIKLYESDEIKNLILAYRKDQKSMLGITKKVLKTQ